MYLELTVRRIGYIYSIFLIVLSLAFFYSIFNPNLFNSVFYLFVMVTIFIIIAFIKNYRYIFSTKQSNDKLLGDIMSFKNALFLYSIFVLILVALVYFTKGPALSLVLVFLFAIAKYVEDHSMINIGRQAKGISYFGLGIVVFIGIQANNTDYIGISYYVVTMCCIEFVDLYFIGKNIEAPGNKKQ